MKLFKSICLVSLICIMPLPGCARSFDRAECDRQIQALDYQRIMQPASEQLDALNKITDLACQNTDGFRMSKAEVLAGMLRLDEAKALVTGMKQETSPFADRLLHFHFIVASAESPGTDPSFHRAEEFAKEYIRRFPDDYLGYMELGVIYGWRDQPKEAFELYHKAKVMVKPDELVKFSLMERSYIRILYNEDKYAEVYRITQNMLKSPVGLWRFTEWSFAGIDSANEIGRTEEARQMLEEFVRNSPAAKQNPFYEQMVAKLSAGTNSK